MEAHILTKITIDDTSVGELNELFGINEEHLPLLESHFDVEMVLRGNELHIFGNENLCAQVAPIIESLRQLYNKGQAITRDRKSVV